MAVIRNANLGLIAATNKSYNGVRPVIEVPKSVID